MLSGTVSAIPGDSGARPNATVGANGNSGKASGSAVEEDIKALGVEIKVPQPGSLARIPGKIGPGREIMLPGA